MLNVVVVGAGIVGASVAYRLAMAGAQVTVLEADRPAAGTSSNSFAWANANEKLPRAYFDLNFAGLQEHYRLADELGSRAFEPSGNLEVAVDPAKRELLRQKVGRLSAWGYRAELIPGERARELAPELSLPAPDGADYAYHLDEVYLRPDGAGRLRIGSEAVDARLLLDGAAPDPELAQDLLDRAQAVLPVVSGARIEGVRLGWRPMPADGRSAVGPVPELAGYYLAFTHSGVTLGPVLGLMVCDELLAGQPRPELAPFRPDRLISQV